MEGGNSTALFRSSHLNIRSSQSRRNHMKRSVSIFFPLSLLIALVVAASAQTPTGALQGSVTDPAKAIISDAVVTVKNKQTGAERAVRSEEHTSELQSLRHLVCRLLLEKKKKNKKQTNIA